MNQNNDKLTPKKKKRGAAIVAVVAYTSLGLKGSAIAAATLAATVMGIKDLIETTSTWGETGLANNKAKRDIRFALPARYLTLIGMMASERIDDKIDVIIATHFKKYGTYEYEPKNHFLLLSEIQECLEKC